MIQDRLTNLLIDNLFTMYEWTTSFIYGRKRGFAFVDLNDHNSEKKAIDDLQDVEWMGREIRVNEAEKRDRPNNKKYNKFNRNN